MINCKKIKWLLIIVSLFVCIAFIKFNYNFAKGTSIVSTANDEIIKNGNMINGGIACSDKNWSYYSIPNYYFFDVCDLNKIYRAKNAGSDFNKINDDPSEMIDIQEEWIYYRNQSPLEYGSIYKVKKNGLGRKRIVKLFSPYDCRSFTPMDFRVKGNKIIYLKLDASSNDNGYGESNLLNPSKLCSIDINGNNNTILCSDTLYGINVVGDWVYYTSLDKNDMKFKLSRIKNDGTQKSVLSYTYMSKFIVDHNTVYYLNKNESNSTMVNLQKLNLLSRKVTKIATNVSSFNLDSYWLYIGYNDKGIYRQRKSGGSILKFSTYNQDCDSICIAGDWIYAHIGAKYVKINKSGSKEIEIDNIFNQNVYKNPKLFGKLYSQFKCKNSKGILFYPKVWSLFDFSGYGLYELPNDVRDIATYDGSVNGRFGFYKVSADSKPNIAKHIKVNCFKTNQGKKGYYYIDSTSGVKDFNCTIGDNKNSFSVHLLLSNDGYNKYKIAIFDMVKGVII